jgi:hypothetical protein
MLYISISINVIYQLMISISINVIYIDQLIISINVLGKTTAYFYSLISVDTDEFNYAEKRRNFLHENGCVFF